MESSHLSIQSPSQKVLSVQKQSQVLNAMVSTECFLSTGKEQNPDVSLSPPFLSRNLLFSTRRCRQGGDCMI